MRAFQTLDLKRSEELSIRKKTHQKLLTSQQEIVLSWYEVSHLWRYLLRHKGINPLGKSEAKYEWGVVFSLATSAAIKCPL